MSGVPIEEVCGCDSCKDWRLRRFVQTAQAKAPHMFKRGALTIMPEPTNDTFVRKDDQAMRREKCAGCYHAQPDYGGSGCRHGLPFPLRTPSDCHGFTRTMPVKHPFYGGSETQPFPLHLAERYMRWYEEGQKLMEEAQLLPPQAPAARVEMTPPGKEANWGPGAEGRQIYNAGKAAGFV